jgi:zinc transporter
MQVPDQHCGYLLDGRGGGRGVTWDEVRRWTAERGTLWLPLNRNDEQARRWLAEESGIDPVIVGGLLAAVSRPRAELIEGGLLMVLRCVDPTPGADPEDLISVRIWAERSRVIMLFRERPGSLGDLEARVVQSEGAHTAGELVAHLVHGVTTRLITVIETVEEAIDELEDRLVDPAQDMDRAVLASLRRRTIGLHRYLLPQVHALRHLETVQTTILDAKQHRIIRDAATRSMRCVEDLDAVRNRAAVIQDELANQLTEQMSRRMYAITVFAAIFLPLTFITGLFGVNLAGIPGADHPFAFAALCLVLGGLGVLGYWAARWSRLL